MKRVRRKKRSYLDCLHHKIPKPCCTVGHWEDSKVYLTSIMYFKRGSFPWLLKYWFRRNQHWVGTGEMKWCYYRLGDKQSVEDVNSHLPWKAHRYRRTESREHLPPRGWSLSIWKSWDSNRKHLHTANLRQHSKLSAEITNLICQALAFPAINYATYYLTFHGLKLTKIPWRESGERKELFGLFSS